MLNLGSVTKKNAVIQRTEIRRPNLWNRVTMYFRSKRQAKKIMTALNEAEQIHSGRKQGKSYDQFLKEI